MSSLGQAGVDSQVWRCMVLAKLCELTGGDEGPSITELLQDILDLLSRSTGFQESFLCDDSGALFIRVRYQDPITGALLPPSFEDLAGNPYTPTSDPKLCSEDRELREGCWQVKAGVVSPSYSPGDRLIQVEFLDAATATHVGTAWKHEASDTWLSTPPPLADREPCPEQTPASIVRCLT